jgi:hypothetical protein
VSRKSHTHTAIKFRVSLLAQSFCADASLFNDQGALCVGAYVQAVSSGGALPNLA